MSSDELTGISFEPTRVTQAIKRTGPEKDHEEKEHPEQNKDEEREGDSVELSHPQPEQAVHVVVHEHQHADDDLQEPGSHIDVTVA